jgi:hypothetical protein
MHILNDNDLKNASTQYQQLELTAARSSTQQPCPLQNQSVQASITINQSNHGPHHSPAAKLSKIAIRVNIQ